MGLLDRGDTKGVAINAIGPQENAPKKLLEALSCDQVEVLLGLISIVAIFEPFIGFFEFVACVLIAVVAFFF